MLALVGTNTTVVTVAAKVITANGLMTRASLYNRGSHPIFWGGSDVNGSNGILLSSGSVKDFELGQGDDVYVVCTATQTAIPTTASWRTQQL